MLTLRSNASTKYYPKNKPNSYNVLLPATLDLEGTWEVAIVDIQYPFKWPNFNEGFVAFMLSVKESEKEKQKDQQPTGETTLAYFQAQCRLSSLQHPLIVDRLLLELDHAADELLHAIRSMDDARRFVEGGK